MSHIMSDGNWKNTTTYSNRYEYTGIDKLIMEYLKDKKLTSPVIIDACCSTGVAINDSRERIKRENINPYIIGIDVTKKKNIKNKAKKNCDEFINEDILNLSYKGPKANIVICSKAVLYVTGVRRYKILKQCISYLLNDGLLITDVDYFEKKSLKIKIINYKKDAKYFWSNLNIFRSGIRGIYNEYNKLRFNPLQKYIIKKTKHDALIYIEQILQGWENRSKYWKLWWKFYCRYYPKS